MTSWVNSVENFLNVLPYPSENPLLDIKINQIVALMSELNGYDKSWELFSYKRDLFDPLRVCGNTLLGTLRVIVNIPTLGLVEWAIKSYCIRTAYKTRAVAGMLLHHEVNPAAKKMIRAAYAISFFWRLFLLPGALELDRSLLEVPQGTLNEWDDFLNKFNEIKKDPLIKDNVDFKLQPFFWNFIER